MGFKDVIRDIGHELKDVGEVAGEVALGGAVVLGEAEAADHGVALDAPVQEVDEFGNPILVEQPVLVDQPVILDGHPRPPEHHEPTPVPAS